MAAQTVAVNAARAQLYDLCSHFEQVMLSSLVPRSFFQPTSVMAASDDAQTPGAGGADQAIGSQADATGTLFTQALSAALERAGGFGLGRELFRMLDQRWA